MINKICAVMLVCLLFVSTNANAEPIDSLYTDELQLIIGELENVKVYSLTRISIADPSIADIVEADSGELLVIGKDVGQTAMFIWDEHGKRTMILEVAEQDLDFVSSRVDRLLQNANILNITHEINEKEGLVVLKGEIYEDQEDEYDAVLSLVGDLVLNLVEVEKSESMIQINMQITELNTTATKSLGVEWGSGDGGLAIGYIETFGSTTGTTGTTNTTGRSNRNKSIVNNFDGSIGDLFKIGQFKRVNSLSATLNALVEEGNGRILSRPKLLILSGEEATFLVGGEIPIRSTTTTNNNIQTNVEFKEFGIGMSITPEIKKGKIDITLNIEVSDVDASNQVGENVAFTTRTANTRLLLNDRQTIVLAGLIKQNRAENIKKVPIISNIPVIGALFRSKSNPTPDLDQELVISLTATIMDNQEEDEKFMSKKKGPEMDMFDELIPQMDDILPTSTIPSGMVSYVRDVQKKIAETTVYPEEAESKGIEGTVKVGMLLLKDGTLAFALVKESSGYEFMDQQALETARNNAPYENFPENINLEEINITIPIVYSLN